MKGTRIISIGLLCLFAFGACANTATIQRMEKDSPCNDPQYLELKEKPIGDMTEREYEYFRDKESACDEYKKTALQVQGNQDMVKDTQNNWLTWYLVAAGLGVVGSLIILSSAP
ncbi:MAG: hypothetical protein RRA94_15395 [Bacteroidota bacterium]|nr:hypothetical protein [Bacteroidota bacterium]